MTSDNNSTMDQKKAKKAMKKALKKAQNRSMQIKRICTRYFAMRLHLNGLFPLESLLVESIQMCDILFVQRPPCLGRLPLDFCAIAQRVDHHSIVAGRLKCVRATTHGKQ